MVNLHPFFQLLHPKPLSPSITGFPHIGHGPIFSTSFGISTLNLDNALSSFFIKSTDSIVKSVISFIKSCFANLPFSISDNVFSRQSVDKIKNDTSLLHKFKAEVPEGAEEVGKCPICGNAIIEGEKGFGCTNWKNGCKYTIWKNDKFIEAMGKKVSKEMVQLLLKNGKVGFRNLKSKKGTLFSAYLRYEKDEKTGYYNWKMEFIN